MPEEELPNPHLPTLEFGDPDHNVAVLLGAIQGHIDDPLYMRVMLEQYQRFIEPRLIDAGFAQEDAARESWAETWRLLSKVLDSNVSIKLLVIEVFDSHLRDEYDLWDKRVIPGDHPEPIVSGFYKKYRDNLLRAEDTRGGFAGTAGHHGLSDW